MEALITGVNGFVGFHLSNLLIKKGFKVYGMDTKGSVNSDEVTLFNVDIRNKERVYSAIKSSKPHCVFHLAAVSSVQLCRENPNLTKQVNVGGTENILSSCIENDINPKILITSSAHVYGIPHHLPINESHPVSPVNEYGKSKLEQENASLNFFKKYKLNVIIARSFNHIGPNQTTGFVCSDIAKQIVKIEKGVKGPSIRVGDLEAKRDFIDVRDIVRAYLLATEKCTSGNIYNICSGKSYSIREILDIMLEFTDKKISVETDLTKIRKNEIPVIEGNNSKFVKATGWKPEIPLKRTLKDLLDYWREAL